MSQASILMVKLCCNRSVTEIRLAISLYDFQNTDVKQEEFSSSRMDLAKVSGWLYLLKIKPKYKIDWDYLLLQRTRLLNRLVLKMEHKAQMRTRVMKF